MLLFCHRYATRSSTVQWRVFKYYCVLKINALCRENIDIHCCQEVLTWYGVPNVQYIYRHHDLLQRSVTELTLGSEVARLREAEKHPSHTGWSTQVRALNG